MEKGWLRTLMVLFCGLSMALMAYAGQSGPSSNDLNLGAIEGESIHVREVNGLRLDFRLLSFAGLEETGDPPEPTELILYIAGKKLRGEPKAMVTFLVIGPRGSQFKALALPIEGRYEADIFLSAPGIYRITTEIQTPKGVIKDVFEHAIS